MGIFLLSLHHDYPYLEHDKRAQSWSLEEGYAPRTPIETYPHRGAVSVGIFVLYTYLLELIYSAFTIFINLVEKYCII